MKAAGDVLLSGEHIRRVLTGDVPATLVDDANLEIRTGEFVAIVGPSGSGKSSLLYILGLLDRPTSGEVMLLGQATSALDDDARTALRLKHLGFVFQAHFLLPEFTALENVLLPMQRAGIPDTEARARASSLLTDLGLKDKQNNLPRQLSGGQSQRVAIARALANKPSLLLADEPTGNLDTHSSAAVQDILRGLAHEAGRAVVVVTHDAAFAKSADRVIKIVDGRIVAT
ncbi:MAG: ABC transporter ATP-binding protein [Holosporales bacterium]